MYHSTFELTQLHKRYESSLQLRYWKLYTPCTKAWMEWESWPTQDNNYFHLLWMSASNKQKLSASDTALWHRPSPVKPLILSSKPDLQFQKKITDIFNKHGKSYMMFVDCYTGGIEVPLLISTNTVAICNALRSCFCTYAAPEDIPTEGGTLFHSLEYNSFLKEETYIIRALSTP